MSYFIRRINAAERPVAHWTGGSTSQLAIYPPQAEYQKRNFLWRLSVATVELDESVFTPLSGIQRVLMLTEGQMLLTHRDQHSACLLPFDKDRFDGGWETTSRGRASDFNLMLSQGCEGDLTLLRLSGQTPVTASITAAGKAGTVCVFYCVDGGASFCDGTTCYQLTAGDALLFSGEQGDGSICLTVSGLTDASVHVIRADIVF